MDYEEGAGYLHAKEQLNTRERRIQGREEELNEREKALINRLQEFDHELESLREEAKLHRMTLENYKNAVPSNAFDGLDDDTVKYFDLWRKYHREATRMRLSWKFLRPGAVPPAVEPSVVEDVFKILKFELDSILVDSHCRLLTPRLPHNDHDHDNNGNITGRNDLHRLTRVISGNEALGDLELGEQIHSFTNSSDPNLVIRAYILAAVHDWVFMSDFPAFSTCPRLSRLFEITFLHADSMGRKQVRHLDAAVWYSLINDQSFQKVSIPELAKKYAHRLSRVLAPLFRNSEQGESYLFDTWGEETKVWQHRETCLQRTFHCALDFKARTVLTEESYEFHVYPPQTQGPNADEWKLASFLIFAREPHGQLNDPPPLINPNNFIGPSPETNSHISKPILHVPLHIKKEPSWQNYPPPPPPPPSPPPPPPPANITPPTPSSHIPISTVSNPSSPNPPLTTQFGVSKAMVDIQTQRSSVEEMENGNMKVDLNSSSGLVCPKCRFEFTKKSNLQAHMRADTHTVCFICTRKARKIGPRTHAGKQKNFDALKKHMREEHKFSLPDSAAPVTGRTILQRRKVDADKRFDSTTKGKTSRIGRSSVEIPKNIFSQDHHHHPRDTRSNRRS